MKKQIIFAIFLTILSVKSFSQIAFENGFFINESNEKINCLIKNNDWMYNPSKFEYKISEDDSVQIADFNEAREFQVPGVFKYVSANVKIDRSSDDINKLSRDKDPIFQDEVLFLKVLIEGEASLYVYETGDLKRFFYKTPDTEIRQLVYRRYLINKLNAVINYMFRQQLFVDLKCQSLTQSNFENIEYNKRDLEKLFIKYNGCMGSGYVTYGAKVKKDLFSLSVKPGLNSTNLTIKNAASGWENDLGHALNFRFGIEAEYILPYNRNKWGIILEPSYQYFNSKNTKEANNVSGGILATEVNYQSIELPIGIRHYFFINDKSKIYINLSYIRDLNNAGSLVKLSRGDGSVLNSFKIKSGQNMSLGIGYNFMNRYIIEMRYNTKRNVLSDYLFWDSEYKAFSIILGYTLF